MATPPSSAAERLFRPPSRRPIGVRAPATMTDTGHRGLLKSKIWVVSTLPTNAAPQEGGPRHTAVSHRSHPVEAPYAAGRGCPHDRSAGHPRPPVHLHRPRRHRRARPRRGDRALPRRRSGWRSSTRRPTRSRASARRWWPSATRGSCIQLLAPIDESSTIAKFLDRSGPGLQQLAYRVTDVEQVSAILRERGLRLLYDAPKRGTADSRINFIHPKDAGGVLVELVRARRGRRTLRDSPTPGAIDLTDG